MKASAKGIDMVCAWEGLVLKVYLDQFGYKTVGYGHKLTGDEIADHAYEPGITKDEARDLMTRDLARFEASVTRSVKVELTQNQFDALVCFSYNVGTGAFESSMLLRLLNSHMYGEVPQQLVRWCHGPRGQVNAGLLRRREHEAALWNTHDAAVPIAPEVTDEDRARVAGMAAVSLAELAREAVEPSDEANS